MLDGYTQRVLLLFFSVGKEIEIEGQNENRGVLRSTTRR
jgi:hypothetical protein